MQKVSNTSESCQVRSILDEERSEIAPKDSISTRGVRREPFGKLNLTLANGTLSHGDIQC